MIKVATTNKTPEGAAVAEEWLSKSSTLLPELRQIFLQYFMECGRSYPWRNTRDPYQILVAEILLQKTAVPPVASVWLRLMERYPTVTDLAFAPVEEIRVIISPLGLPKRAEVLQAAARLIVANGGEIPPDPAFLRSMPGVGSYTSEAILSYALNVRVAAVDVNAARVYTRIGGFLPNTLRQGLAYAKRVATEMLTQKSHREVNLGVLDLAAEICRPAPLCDRCPVLASCNYGQERPKAERSWWRH